MGGMKGRSGRSGCPESGRLSYCQAGPSRFVEDYNKPEKIMITCHNDCKSMKNIAGRHCKTSWQKKKKKKHDRGLAPTLFRLGRTRDDTRHCGFVERPGEKPAEMFKPFMVNSNPPPATNMLRQRWFRWIRTDYRTPIRAR